MAGNPCQDLNSNPFIPGVQLHRTPQASTRPRFSAAISNAGGADEDMSNGMRTEVNNPLMLGGNISAPAMTSGGERSRQSPIFSTQAPARSAGSDISMQGGLFPALAMNSGSPASMIMPTSGTDVRYAGSDLDSLFGWEDGSVWVPSTGKVVSSLTSGDIGQVDLIDVDTSFLASGYDSVEFGHDKPSLHRDNARARGQWALGTLQAGGNGGIHKQSDRDVLPVKLVDEKTDSAPFKPSLFASSPYKHDSSPQAYGTGDNQRNLPMHVGHQSSDSCLFPLIKSAMQNEDQQSSDRDNWPSSRPAMQNDGVQTNLLIDHQPSDIFQSSRSAVQTEDQSKESTFEAFVIKQPDPGSHGPMSFPAPGKEETIDLMSEVNSLTDTLTPVLDVKQAFKDHPSYPNFVSLYDNDLFTLAIQNAIDMGIVNPQGADILCNSLAQTFRTSSETILNDFTMPMIIDSVRSTFKSHLPEQVSTIEKLCETLRVDRPNSERQHIPILKEEDKKKQLVLELSGIGVTNVTNLLSGASPQIDAKALDIAVTECTTTVKILEQAMVSKVCDFAHRAQPNKALNMRDIKLPTGLQGDADAKTARQLCDNILDYFMQDPGLFYPLIFVHVTLRDLLFVEGQLVIPPSIRDQAYGKTLHLPEAFKKVYDEANQNLGALVRARFEVLSQASRAGRKFDYGGRGRSVFIIGDSSDGMSALWFHIIRHAQKTHEQCLQIRDRLQHAGGLFVSGPIKNSVETVRKDIELATSLNIVVEPLSVLMVILKNLGNRHQAFMNLFDEAKRSEHLMTTEDGVAILDIYMTKVEDTAREFSLFEKNITSANLAESKIQESESKAFYSSSSSSQQIPSGAPTGTQEKMFCFAKDCNEEVGSYAVKNHLFIIKTNPQSKKPKPVCQRCFNSLLVGEGKVKITQEDGSTLTYDKQRHESSLIRLRSKQPKQASNVVATQKAPADADEGNLIELQKQNAELREQLGEKEKTGNQQGQLDQIAQMLMEQKAARVVEMKTRPGSNDLLRAKGANGPLSPSG